MARKPSLTTTDVQVFDRFVTVVSALGPRGGAQYYAVHTGRLDGEPRGAFHSPSSAYIQPADLPPVVREAARRAWMLRYAS
jgi:hypothetical protein